MTPDQFTYWMQGFVELTNGAPPTPEQWGSICEHLKLVFHKVTPPVRNVPEWPDMNKSEPFRWPTQTIC